MKRRNWLLISLSVTGLTGFLLSRTVWGPPSNAAAAELAIETAADEDMSDAQRRYISNSPRHWRHVMLKR